MSFGQSPAMGPPARVGYALVCLYRVTLGLFLGGHCRFWPSCSAYALDALRAQPFGRALALVAGRLARCHPWHPGGVDPVPASPLPQMRPNFAREAPQRR